MTAKVKKPRKTILRFPRRLVIVPERLLIPISHFMKSSTQKTQHYLAKQLIQLDNQLIQESKIAYLKVQSWHFAVNTPEIGKAYLMEAASMINKAFLSFVPNNFVLTEEGFYYHPIEN
jgi:hypothetical protein